MKRLDPMPRPVLATVFLCLMFCTPLFAQDAARLSLEQIMAHPDWIGIAPERPYFSQDGQSIYFMRKAAGSELRDLYRVGVNGGAAKKLSIAETVVAQTEQRFVSADAKQTAWLRAGNLFVLKEAKLEQITRTGDLSGLLGFVGNDTLAFRNEGKVNLFNLRTAQQTLLVNLKTEDDPQLKKESPDYLTADQSRLFEIIQKREKNKREQEARQREMQAQEASAPSPIYLGKGREIRSLSLSPDARFLVVTTVLPKRDGRSDKMAHYVSADGYVKIEDVRSKVGTDQGSDELLYLIDVSAHLAHKITLDQLPGVNEDTLWALRIEAAKRAGKPEPKAGVPRPVYLGFRGVQWNTKAARVALSLFSADNKDRWIVDVDLNANSNLSLTEKEAQKITPQFRHRLTDQAWVNDNDFSEFAWTADGQALWYLSEESAYSQLYVQRDGRAQALTKGAFEVSHVTPSDDGKWFYYRANKKQPGIYEVYRVSSDGVHDEALTDMGGVLDYELSPKQDRLLLNFSSVTRQPDLFVQAAKPQSKALRLTESTSPEFARIHWIEPEIVAIPSKHGAAPIYSRIYRDNRSTTGAAKPAVMFVHGAGYLQAAHHGWSNYFREMMFHNLLVQEGYVVIDMDYRASAGYGRDWRTAIYQRMGTPELEDYLDGLDWLVENAHVDRNRVGIYGGSYGGFMTFMAMFKSDAFAAGAALRPVADWAHYNHGYTSNILNTPELDPKAYLRSSPIEFAAGLKRPLLICSGILDDNVFFQDSVRMVQKLIELKNPNFELAVYPIEPHGFREPESWLDEYRRIFKLMEREVKARPAPAPK